MQLTETELKGLCSLKSIFQPNGVSRAPVGVSTRVCMFFNFLFFLFLQTKPSFCRLFAWSQGQTFLPFLFQFLQCL